MKNLVWSTRGCCVPQKKKFFFGGTQHPLGLPVDLQRLSPWAKSEKVTVWSHEREQRFDTSNLFFNLWKTVMAWSYWAEACKTWRKWAKSVLPMVAMATGHRFARNPPFNASKGCVKWSKGITYSWETLDFAGLQKNREIRDQKTRIFSFLASRCNHVLKLVTLLKNNSLTLLLLNLAS